MPSPNDPPEIPSFRNPKKDPDPLPLKEAEPSASQDKERKLGAPPLFPTGPNGPALKVRGLASGPKTLLDRLKQFQKKDLVFIASGLGVLFLAPLAEHFMMNPNQQDNVLKGGFDDKNKIFGADMSPYEPGAGGMSPGGLVGAGSDIITPLNVRDPSTLVMGPGATQQPPPSASVSAPPPPKSDSGGWKDALSAAQKGAEAGAKAASPGAFRAPGNLAGGLRGLSALSGGSYGGGPSYSMAPPSASNVPNRGVQSNALGRVQSAPGYRGVAARGPAQGSSGAEALKKAAENAGNLFNRSGSAANNLDAAAKEAIPAGGASGGGTGSPSGGGENKSPGGSNSKDNKSLGESLAFIKAKMEMEKELDIKYSKKKWKEFEFPKMVTETIAKGALDGILTKGIFEPIGGAIKDMFNPPNMLGGVYCSPGPGQPGTPLRNTPDGKNKWRCEGPEFKSAINLGTPGQPVPCRGGCVAFGGGGGGGGAEKPAGPEGAGGTIGSIQGPEAERAQALAQADQRSRQNEALAGSLSQFLSRSCPGGIARGDVEGGPAACRIATTLNELHGQLRGVGQNVRAAENGLAAGYANLAQAVGTDGSNGSMSFAIGQIRTEFVPRFQGLSALAQEAKTALEAAKGNGAIAEFNKAKDKIAGAQGASEGVKQKFVAATGGEPTAPGFGSANGDPQLDRGPIKAAHETVKPVADRLNVAETDLRGAFQQYRTGVDALRTIQDRLSEITGGDLRTRVTPEAAGQIAQVAQNGRGRVAAWAESFRTLAVQESEHLRRFGGQDSAAIDNAPEDSRLRQGWDARSAARALETKAFYGIGGGLILARRGVMQGGGANALAQHSFPAPPDPAPADTFQQRVKDAADGQLTTLSPLVEKVKEDHAAVSNALVAVSNQLIEVRRAVTKR